MDTPALRKARGAFFTPPQLTEYITRWAIRTRRDTVFEPSCGDAEFLVAAVDRLQALGAGPTLEGQLNGVEIHAASAQQAIDRIKALGASAEVAQSDFFDQTPPSPAFDVVIGNPPYVRYQNFSGEARLKGLQAALSQGIRLTGLASSWAAFTIHSANFLKPDGRLGLVLPAELLSVNYASQVRRFLLKRFSKVRLVLFEELVFPDVIAEVVLLLAEGSGGCSNFEVFQARNLHDLSGGGAASWIGYAPTPQNDKWTPALITAQANDAYLRLCNSDGFAELQDWGDAYLGAVTGNNAFFTLTRADASRLGLGLDELLPISPPGSKHLRGLTFGQRAWESLAKEGKRCFLFAPGTKPSPAALAYIAVGEAAGVSKGYKCRNRKPWWRVPLVAKPDLLFTYMNHERPRLINNDCGVHLLNSLYGVTLQEKVRSLGSELLPLASLNSATLLGAEMVGRSYGGGLLKHEPKEADLLPVPSLITIKAASEDLRALRPQIAAALRAPDPKRAIELVDQVVLSKHLSLSEEDISSIRNAREALFRRRLTRSRADSADG